VGLAPGFPIRRDNMSYSAATEPNGQPILQMRGITKAFPGILANSDVDFELKKGEIHCLLGENGAGKSTLMKILYGLYKQDKGEILYKGRPLVVSGPADTLKKGIGMVHQHFMLIKPLTVAENLVLGNEPVKAGFLIDQKRAKAELLEISHNFGLAIDPDARILDISVGMQQRVEILKALHRGAEVLILDEPTAVLTPQETKELFVIMRKLIADGKSIIFISHKLKEVLEISDRVTVINHGRIIGSVETSKTTASQLANMMVGREVELVVQKSKAKPGKEAFRVENLTAENDRGLPALRGVSFDVKEGEILGICGVDGNGQTELVQCITGMRKLASGKVTLNGKDITNLPPRKCYEAGIVHVPEDRQKHGLVLDFTVAENMVLQNFNKKPFSSGINLKWDVIKSHARKLISEFDVRTPDEDTAAGSLSGGNQQKAILARELSRTPSLIIVAQPTRGLDVGAIEYIHRKLVAERDAGKAVLLVSLELDEIMALSDRIAVMYEGRIMGIMPIEEATEEKLGLMMAGSVPQASKGVM